MKIKTKLTSGIGLLFMIIVLLGVLAISYIDKLADDTKNILSDNYNSLDYAKGMLYALDNLETDREALNIFMENLEKQRLNITEINESEATNRLARHFNLGRTPPPAGPAISNCWTRILANRTSGNSGWI